MRLWDYMILCLGGRLDWVPFSHLLKRCAREMKQDTFASKKAKRGKSQHVDSPKTPTTKLWMEHFQTLLASRFDPYVILNSSNDQHIVVDNNGVHYIVFDFEHLVTIFLCGKQPYRLEFQFSDTTLRKLVEILYLIPYHEDETTESIMDLFQKMHSPHIPLLIDESEKAIKYGKPILLFGPNCCKRVHLSALKDLHIAAKGRFHKYVYLRCFFFLKKKMCALSQSVHLLWNDINWDDIIKQSIVAEGHNLRRQLRIAEKKIIRLEKETRLEFTDVNFFFWFIFPKKKKN
ncbi:hypothetical protein RFI_07088 [Reticulomyxa filosa]|uniref:Uncharacterized protein n=1 Tax=Reticulomyxa filosa TaxID=46433 RepID=X6NUQ5_RETFI|nr:hypothetical protein RFI_07088 [Reticulomyxa filosa]|eukprot:ETO30035.1 hypothetical protein RFI_07088 [Reticulomyxa filosa]